MSDRPHWSSFLDVQSPVFRPLWLRVLITGVSTAWIFVELSSGAYLWALLFAAVSAYLFYQFFVVYRHGGEE